MKRSIHVLIAATVLLLNGSIIFSAPVTIAQSGKGGDPVAQQEKQQTTGEPAKGYTFEASRGYNLSLLVRRALQLYDRQNDEVSLSPAATIYTETNLVQRLGSRHLRIGEVVTIERALIEEHVQKSKTLSAEKLAAWQKYADRASFDLNHINTMGTSSSVTEEPSQPSDSDKQDMPSADSGDAQTEKESGKDQAVIWWFTAIIALGGIYYLLGQDKKR